MIGANEKHGYVWRLVIELSIRVMLVQGIKSENIKRSIAYFICLVCYKGREGFSLQSRPMETKLVLFVAW